MVIVRSVDEELISDLIRVCSNSFPPEPPYSVSVEIKKNWVIDMLSRHGSIAKIAYL